MTGYSMLIALLLAILSISTEGQTHFKFIKMTCLVPDRRILTVHECNAENHLLNVSVSLHRRLTEPFYVRKAYHCCYFKGSA